MTVNPRWLLVGILLSLSMTTWLGISLAQCPGGGGACTGPCDDGMKTVRDVFGTVECEHGPEYDTDCGNPPTCCETQPGGCTHAAGECSCYGCGNNANCEADFHYWICGCGQCTTYGFTGPTGVGGPCADCKAAGGANQILKEGRDMDAAGGQSCDAGENFWMTWVFWCGDPNPLIQAGNCQAIDDSMCVHSPGSAWITLRRGQRYTCQPGA